MSGLGLPLNLSKPISNLSRTYPKPIQTYMNLSNPIPILSKPIPNIFQTYHKPITNLSKHFQNLFKPPKTYSKPIQIYPTISKHIQMYPNLSKPTQIFPNLTQTYPNTIQTYLILSKPICNLSQNYL